jgi:integrase
MKAPSGSVKPIRKNGKVVGYHVRITWRENGVRRSKKESMIGATKNEALDRCRLWRKKWEDHGSVNARPIVTGGGDSRTFTDLALYYNERYAKPAVYVNERRAEGMESWVTQRGHVNRLAYLVGMVTLRELQYADLDDAKEALSKDGIAIATVNRVMSTCRRMLKIARQRGWMDHDPFSAGDPLVRRGLESHDERVMTRKEEAKILAHCTGKRLHLRYAMITAVETGMREGEIGALQKKAGVYGPEGYEMPYVDWKRRMITVTWYYSKNHRARIVPMTKRLYRELSEWRDLTSPNDSSLFANAMTFDTAWRSAQTAARVDGLKFHHLKHTFVTRAIEAGVPPMIVSMIADHAPQKDAIAAPTTKRYANMYEQAAVDAAKKLDNFSRVN